MSGKIRKLVAAALSERGPLSTVQLGQLLGIKAHAVTDACRRWSYVDADGPYIHSFSGRTAVYALPEPGKQRPQNAEFSAKRPRWSPTREVVRVEMAVLEPHIVSWLTNPSVTLSSVAVACGYTENQVRYQLEKHSIRRSEEVTRESLRLLSKRARTRLRAKRAASAVEVDQPEIPPPPPVRVASVWHLASGVFLGGGLRNVYEVRT